jgi:NAD(P)-dependent dehydrogenase (short-subunit alcohol dehydrogenase family)
VIKTLADDFGPSGVRINGVLPVRIATERVREFDALSGDPDEVRAGQSKLMPKGTESPKSSREQQRFCSPQPLPTSPVQ